MLRDFCNLFATSMRSFTLAAGIWLALVPTTGCGATAPTVPLTIARQLEGTWRTAAPVTFYYQTDFCNFVERKDTVGRSNWSVTWAAAAASGYENVLNVDMSISSTPMITVGGCVPGGYVPFVSPTSFRANLGSSAITVGANDRHGIYFSGSYTTNRIEVTWDHWECLIYCFGEYTETLGLKLVKQ